MTGTALRVLAALACAILATGCGSWALTSGSAVEQAGSKVYSQVQTVRLAAQAGQRGDPPTISLGVIVDDADTTLSDEAETVGQEPAGEAHRDDLLGLV